MRADVEVIPRSSAGSLNLGRAGRGDTIEVGAKGRRGFGRSSGRRILPVNEDLQSPVQNPGFNNAAYPADDYSMPKGSPGVGFVPFDPSQAGRTNPLLKPPAVAATFPTKMYNPATDY